MATVGRLRTALRDATRDQHEALDRAVDFTTDLTVERYVAFLQRSLAALDLLEPSVMRWVPDRTSPTRRECLRADLTALAAQPIAPRAPSFVPETEAQGIGAAYVLEGSTLGGQVLAKAVEDKLALTATSYLRLRGAQTGAMWKSFIGLLDERDAAMSEEERETCCAAARETFVHFRAAFAQGAA